MRSRHPVFIAWAVPGEKRTVCSSEGFERENHDRCERVWWLLSVARYGLARHGIGFSLEVSVSEYCGGPFPVDDVGAVVYDAVAGERYSPLSLYRVGWQEGIDGPVKWRADIRDAIKRSLVRGAMAMHDGGECSSVIQGDNAGYSASAIDAAKLGLGRDGLYVYPEPAHVLSACYETVVLPYASVRQYLNRVEVSRLGWTAP
jgi:hypothetical protein